MPYLKILGSPELSVDGKTVRPFKKALALMVYLFVESGRTHTRDYLSELLWPDRSPKRAYNSLRQSIHLLRTAFSRHDDIPVILTSPKHIYLNPEISQKFDASGFFYPPPGCEILHDPQRCHSCNEHMMGILLSIRGPVLEDFSFPECDELENWLTAIREDLTERSRWACDRVVSEMKEKNQLGKAVRFLDRFLKMNPLDEERSRTQMTFLWKMGDIRGVEDRYAILRKALKVEMDTDLEFETRDLLSKILSGSSVKTPVSPFSSSEPEKWILLEWRQATALVIDLHFTDALDVPLNSPSILERLLKPIQEFGSIEWQITEHGFLAWFGTDGVSDRASIRAARAAQEIGRIVEGIRKTTSEHIEFRGGIHSGRILKNPQSNSTDPTGTLSRSAMALCMQAPPETILISSDAYQTLRGRFPHVGTMPIFLLRRKTMGYVLPSSLRQEGPYFSDLPPLIGRDEERQVFLNLYSENRGGILVVDGEAGVGKSALVQTFLLDGVRLGADFRMIECYPQTWDASISPFTDLIRADSRIHHESDPKWADRHLFDYLQSLDIKPEANTLDVLRVLLSLSNYEQDNLPADLRSTFHQKLLPLLVKIFNAWSRKHPLILLMEDVHWIDPQMGILLEILRDPSLSKRIFFIFSQRTGERPASLCSLPGSKLIELKPLSLEDSCKMVHSLPGGDSLTEIEMHRVVTIGEGFPLYLKEMTRELLESFNKNNRIPSSIGEILESRLSLLGESRTLVLIASVIGLRVPVDLLRVLVPSSSKIFEQHLYEVLRSDLLFLLPEPFKGWGKTLAFRHTLVQEGITRSLSKKSLLGVHRKVAITLREHFPKQANDTPEIVAYHFDRSGESEEAALWYEKVRKITIKKSVHRGKGGHETGLGPPLTTSPPIPIFRAIT